MNPKHILIVEDEAMIAMFIEDVLADEGHIVIGPVGTVHRALELISASSHIDYALLDVNLRGELVYPVADALNARQIPFAFASGYGVAGIDPCYRGQRVLAKPINPQRLISFITAALAAE